MNNKIIILCFSIVCKLFSDFQNAWDFENASTTIARLIYTRLLALDNCRSTTSTVDGMPLVQPHDEVTALLRGRLEHVASIRGSLADVVRPEVRVLRSGQPQPVVLALDY